nr:MAG TPA: Head Tail Connector Protein [Caudoviricetes sp.]
MTEEIKIMLGDAAENFTDSQIGLALKQSLAEVEAYTNRKIDYELEIIAERIAVIKLNRTNTEGLSSQSYSGVSESYFDGYPADIQAVLNRKRKIKFV